MSENNAECKHTEVRRVVDVFVTGRHIAWECRKCEMRFEPAAIARESRDQANLNQEKWVNIADDLARERDRLSALLAKVAACIWPSSLRDEINATLALVPARTRTKP